MSGRQQMAWTGYLARPSAVTLEVATSQSTTEHSGLRPMDTSQLESCGCNTENQGQNGNWLNSHGAHLSERHCLHS